MEFTDLSRFISFFIRILFYFFLLKEMVFIHNRE